MNWLVDAQLPKRLAVWLCSIGEDALHTLDLPEKNSTPDSTIAEIATIQGRIVISKDSDFIHSCLLHGKPPQLLVVTTGNIHNDELFTIFGKALPRLRELFQYHTILELSSTSIIIRL